MRALKRRKLVSHRTAQSQNKLIYQLLPDGMICAYAARGVPNCPSGYMQPALRSIQETLKSNTESELTINVMTVLPLKCPRTNLSRKIDYAKGTKKMAFVAFFFFVIRPFLTRKRILKHSSITMCVGIRMSYRPLLVY